MQLSDGPDPEPTSPPSHTVAAPQDNLTPSTATPPPKPSMTQEVLAARIAKSLHSYTILDLLSHEPDPERLSNTSADPEARPDISLERFLEALPLMSEKPVPDIISHKKVASFNDHPEYFHLHTAAERQTLYSGFRDGHDPSSERINIDVSCDHQACPAVHQQFDRDSFTAFASSIAVAAQGLDVYMQQALVSNMTTDLHLPTHSIPINHSNDELDEFTGAPQSRKVRIDFIPNICLGRFIGDNTVTINMFFPHLFDINIHNKFHEGRGRRLTDAQYHKFMDAILLPALYDGCSTAVNQEYPASGLHAQLNAQAKYSETRSCKIDAVPRQQVLSHPVSADRLPHIQWVMQERAARAGNREFRDVFLLINAKGRKLDHVKSGCWSTAADRLRAWRTNIFNVRYLDEDATYVDLGKAIVPDHTSIHALQDPLHQAGQTLFWREDYLRQFFQWLDDGSTDGLKKAPRFWQIAFLKHISAATNEYPRGSDLHRFGLLYAQFYPSFKNVLAAADTYLFENPAIANLAIGKHQMALLQRVAGALTVDPKCLLSAYLHCKARCHEALTASLQKSFGIRQEYRVSWKLFELIDVEMRRLDPTPNPSPSATARSGWLAVPTQRVCEWHRWNINKFCFGFEMVNSYSPQTSIPWDHSRVMLLFLMCLPAFLGRDHPDTFRRLWLSDLPAKANKESRERGLGIGVNLTAYGYGWLDPVIDYNTMTFRTELTHCIGFDTLPMLGQFKRTFYSTAGFWQDTLVIAHAEQWLTQFSAEPVKTQMIAELFRQICLRAFRRDVYATVKQDITKALRGQALRGNYPLTESTLQAVFHPAAPPITFAVAKNQRIRYYSQLFQTLWGNNDCLERGSWADRAGYRVLYQKCDEALTRIIGPQVATQWRSTFREYLRQTHWLLPYPGQSLVSRGSKGESRWWTSYNEIIDTFNQQTAGHDSQFQLDASVMREWPTVQWDDHMQDFRQCYPSACSKHTFIG